MGVQAGTGDRDPDEALLFDAISHDLNNVLASIAGHAEQVASALPASHPGRRDLELVHRDVRKASVLIGLCHGVGSVLARTVDLREVATMAARLLRKLLPAGQEVQVQGVSPGWDVRADDAAVLEVLLALARSGAPGGPPPVLERAEAPGQRGLRVAFPGGLDAGTAAPARAAELIGAMGGELRREGAGWDVLLPAEAPATRRAAEHAPRLDSVLLVEPDALLRSFLVTALDARNVEEAGDGFRAGEVLRGRGETFDLVVLPLDLEDFDALEQYSDLRAKNPELKFVFIGRDESVPDRLRALVASDARSLLVRKPFGVADLVRAIDGLAPAGVGPREVTP